MTRTLDLDHIHAEFATQGFSIVPDVLDNTAVAELRTAVDEALDADWERYAGLPGKEQFIALDLAQYGGPLLGIFDNDVIDTLFASILGEHWILYSYTSTVQLPHADQYTSQIHTDTARIVDGYDLSAVMTLALDDFTEENGATWYLPGSHLDRPERPSDEEFYNGAVRVTRRAGDVVFFHPRVWHAGGHNQTDTTRSGLTIYGCRSFMRQRLDYPRMVPPRVLEGMSDRVRRVLGFNVRVPTCMDEFYVEPDRRLYKSGQG